MDTGINVFSKGDEKGINPILRAILEGVYDTGSPLSRLRGTPHLVQFIWKLIVQYWKSLIKMGLEVQTPRDMEPGTSKNVPQDKFVIQSEHIRAFPEPNNININMMPFVMNKKFEECYLPENLRQYWEYLIKPLFRSYHANAKSEEGKICFLTIHESLVGSNESQRRPGLHTDNPGTISFNDDQVTSSGDNDTKDDKSKGRGSSHVRFYEHHWGMGVNLRHDEVEGGIYMASNVKKSCAVWNSQIQCDEGNGKEIIGEHGDIEFLRPYIGKPKLMKPNHLYWITDRTPHESLPLKEETYRQYFRLVTHEVSLWFEDHSTKNPLGLVPDSNITKIIKGSKFGDPTQLRVVSGYKQKVPLGDINVV